MLAARQLRCIPRLVIPPCRLASHRPGQQIPTPNAQSLGLRKLSVKRLCRDSPVSLAVVPTGEEAMVSAGLG